MATTKPRELNAPTSPLHAALRAFKRDPLGHTRQMAKNPAFVQGLVVGGVAGVVGTFLVSRLLRSRSTGYTLAIVPT